MAASHITVSRSPSPLEGTVRLTGSKSECNRALLISALSGGCVSLDNYSDAADTKTLTEALKAADSSGGQLPRIVDIGPAGTAMRFLTAYFSLKEGKVLLTGSERMKQRPIGILVNALRELGARITYAGEAGYPPLLIEGGFTQQTECISVEGNVSSQYITALLLLAPCLPEGLRLEIRGELTSRPYVEMTLSMLSQAGIVHQWSENSIVIPHQAFSRTTLHVEPDWSAASYWYAFTALSPAANIFLPGLVASSLQGDHVIRHLMEDFGVRSTFANGGLRLQKVTANRVRRPFDFKSCPDLAQTVIVLCAALGHEAEFTGLQTLRIKETDRVKALQNELAGIGVRLHEDKEVYTLDCSHRVRPDRLLVHTYDDHRMAMAFAPLALVLPEVVIEDYRVVEKSYPAYWDDLRSMGFSVQVH